MKTLLLLVLVITGACGKDLSQPPNPDDPSQLGCPPTTAQINTFMPVWSKDPRYSGMDQKSMAESIETYACLVTAGPGIYPPWWLQ